MPLHTILLLVDNMFLLTETLRRTYGLYKLNIYHIICSIITVISSVYLIWFVKENLPVANFYLIVFNEYTIFLTGKTVLNSGEN